MKEKSKGDVKGFRTLFPETFIKYKEVERIISEIAQRFSYFPIETPAIEYADVLLAKGGLSPEQTKEIFLFDDYGGRKVGLRFDLTTPIARVIGNRYHEFKPKMPLRWYYFTKMWRYEQPQKGRYREFWQFGLELINANSEFADAETIIIADRILKEFKLNDVIIFVSHRDILLELAKANDAKDPIEVVRIIDKKDKVSKEKIIEMLKPLVKDVNLFSELLDVKPNTFENLKEIFEKISINEKIKDAISYLERVMRILNENKVNALIDLTLARGFDYYTGIIYEANVFKDEKKIGGSLLGGGRYDGLIELFGGEKTPSVGFAIGIDRLINELDARNWDWPKAKPKYHIIVDLNNLELSKEAMKLAENLRERFSVSVCINKYDSWKKLLKKELKYAANNEIEYVIIVDDNIKDGKVIVKDMKTGKQELKDVDAFLRD